MKIAKHFSILAIILLILINCSEDDGPGLSEYYEGSITDSISVVMLSDTIIIIIEQFPSSYQVQEEITNTLIDNNSMQDTVSLILNVNYGSYSPTPTPFKDVYLSNDTLRIWYAKIARPEPYNFNKVATSPAEEYFNIENVTIMKSSFKSINFISELYFYK